ncbi:metallophosphoesterase family protein [Enterococcus sp. LJL51]|uniref:metallophosphoesterase family protein n=1 Tax=Enterococcus sp. LJL51 TaxID=3416656 RepID=UPI003CF1B82D
MKLLHTADLHMDRSFEGLNVLPAQLAEQLRSANKKVLNRLVDVAIKKQVDAVIFAGDTFHQSKTSIQTQTYLMEALQRLNRENIHVVISFGNHDYYDSDRYWFDFPENVYLFEKEEVETHYFVTNNNERIAVSGFSYRGQHLEQSKLGEFPQKASDADIHIGIYHGEPAAEAESNYAPFSLSEMKLLGYDYWALGHIHQPQILSAEPLIVYPGTPQGHTKKERDLQGAAIVTIQGSNGTVHFEPVAEVSWERTSYVLTECKTKKAALAFLEKELLKEASGRSRLCLKEIQLEDMNHLGQEFSISCENGELLGYLQTKLPKERLFVFNVSAKNYPRYHKLLVKADPMLLEQLENNYLQPEIFSEEMKELLANPTVSNLMLNGEKGV